MTVINDKKNKPNPIVSRIIVQGFVVYLILHDLVFISLYASSYPEGHKR